MWEYNELEIEKLRLKAWDWYLRGDREQSVSELRVETLESEIMWVWEWVESEIVWKMGDAVVWRCGAQGPERQRVRELKSEDEKWTEILRYRVFVQTVRFALLFFYFLFQPESAGLVPVSVVVANTARVGPNWPDSARIDPSLCRASASREKKRKGRGTDAQALKIIVVWYWCWLWRYGIKRDDIGKKNKEKINK